ncbi:Beta-barrel assembly-enhancing protease [compost metagenome]
MPETTYMVVDPRRDHSLRIPRPDLSAALGTPDACSQCHTAQGPEWAAAQIRRHHPDSRPGFQDFAATFATAELGLPSALEDLARRIGDLNQPSLVRASAAARLGLRAESRHWADLAPGLRDPDPVVRLASATALTGAPPEKRSEWLTPLLGDASRVVRIEAARLLADLLLSAEYTQSQAHALAEYEASLRLHADRAESRVAMAALRQSQGRLSEARAELEQALALDPLSVQSHLNLADLFRALGEEEQSTQLLRQGIERQPQTALLHYALGLNLVRQKQPEAARASLLTAYQLAPRDARIASAHALGLWPSQADAALAVLEQAVKLHPYHAQLRNAAASFTWQSGNRGAALRHAHCLKALQPDSKIATQLLGEHSGTEGQLDVMQKCSSNEDQGRQRPNAADSAW